MNKILFSILIAVVVLLNICSTEAQANSIKHRKGSVARTNIKPKIDGDLSDSVWKKSEIFTDFTEYQPNSLAPAKMKTEARILYDNSAIYVAVRMEDTAAVKIARQFGPRDGVDEQYVDLFNFEISPYNDGITSYLFTVASTGVISDQKVVQSAYDKTWNAVWKGEAKIYDWGWSVEMEIPFSQLRFSPQNHEWGFNLWRLIKRNNEWDTYNPVDINIEGTNHQEGILEGFKSIDTPLRLSLSPYMSFTTENSSAGRENTVKGGLDLRYGISKSFTLDMMVIPDFTQVRSDDIQLNLTTVEQKFSENRQFFNEGSELFQRGGIFYSRRIGGTPLYSSRASETLGQNEFIKETATSTSMINATKISGRTAKGVGVGFLNAITSDTYATIKNSETNESRDVNIQPLTNYNVSVVDVPIRSNSYISAINTNMYIPHGRFSANTSALDFYIADKTSSYAASGQFQYAFQSDSGKVDNDGLAYNFNLMKTSGLLRLGLSQTLFQDTYNPNYMGYIEQNNRIVTEGRIELVSYKQKESTKYRRLMLLFTNELLYKPLKYSRNEIYISGATTFNNEFHLELETSITPNEKYDYFEPRQEGYKYAEPRAIWFGFIMNTDWRKPLSINTLKVGYWMAEKYGKRYLNINLIPQVRIGNHLSATIGFLGEFNKNAIGFAENDSLTNVPIFGRRNIKNYEQSLSLSYIINKNAYTNIRARYNWTSVEYKQFYNLRKSDGWVDGIDFLQNRDINYTSACLETNFVWNFLPGSELVLMYRKSFDQQLNISPISYSTNLKRLGEMPQRDLISFKILYYWDYRKK